jgi:YihY family inner membrane protein
MVAYNLMLAIFPFSLLLLFVAGQVLRSPDIQASVLDDLVSVFPSVEADTLERTLDRVRENSTSIGVISAVGGLWIGTSFFGALDTAFCRIYHGECRSWVAQKRFALGMLGVVVLFMLAMIGVPAVESLLVASAEDLPFGLSELPGVVTAVTLGVGLVAMFGVLCLIYGLTPKPKLPWTAVWPGALGATLALGTVNWGFPLYLSSVSTLARLGPSVGFVLVALIWFYIVSLIVLSGAIVNAMRDERIRTGRVGAAERGVSFT